MFLTQSEFGELFGVTFGTVNRWEKGKYEPTMKIKRLLSPYFKKHNINIGE